MREQTGGEQAVGRRARLRAQTTAEIKDIALKHLSEGGPGAVSLRAIGREMGMSGSAIYSYFETRDGLITALINDIYSSLLDRLETARDAVPADDTGGRILAWGQAFRLWSLDNPEGFRLIYGDPTPGYQLPSGGRAPDAAKRACLALVDLAAAAWPSASAVQVSADYDWSDFAPELTNTIQAHFPGLPPAAVALALRMWGRMHGLVCLEVYGHLGTQTREPAKLYASELLELLKSLGLGANTQASVSG
jgi:AcrR family transcriptional regulator